MPRLRACRLGLPTQRRQSVRVVIISGSMRNSMTAPRRALSAISKAGENSSVRVTTAPNAP